MRKKKRFDLQGTAERSISEFIAENGPMREEQIFPVIRRLCMLLDGMSDNSTRQLICPATVMLDEYGYVRIAERRPSADEIGPFLAPEQDSSEQTAQSEKVYALGMLMLYMATGQVKKTEAEISLDKSRILPVIQRCTAFDPMNRYEDISAVQNAVKREARFGKKLIPFVLYILLAAALAVLVMASWQKGGADGERTGDPEGFLPGYADGYDRGFYNAPGITVNAASVNVRSGNLSGNYASGRGPTSAYSEKYVFFLMNGYIHRMDAVTGEIRQLKEAAEAYSLQYYQGSVYCCTPEHILRIDPDTGKEEIFSESLGGLLYIFEDAFYLYDSAGTNYLYRISGNGKDLTQLGGAKEYVCLNIVDGKLIYIDPNQGNGICSSNADGSDLKVISSGSYESFCVYEDKIYAGTAYGLFRMDLNGANPEILTTLPAFLPNASDSGLFYISGSGRTLEWMSSDGRTRYTVVPARTDSFQVAGRWILYVNEDDGGRLWRVRVSGADNERAALQ